MPEPVRGVLFDLDGTLADTAPDLASALNRVLTEENRLPLALEVIRPLVSQGGRAMVERAFGRQTTAWGAVGERLLQRFLEAYQQNLVSLTRLFPGMETVLADLERCSVPWGVVTNKPQWLTEPLLEGLGLTARAACIVSGDTTANRKPHPEPLLFACRQLGTRAAQCIYVGDAAKDIEAGRRAGMRTLVALFGYIPEDEDPESWGADGALAAPEDLLPWFRGGPEGAK